MFATRIAVMIMINQNQDCDKDITIIIRCDISHNQYDCSTLIVGYYPELITTKVKLLRAAGQIQLWVTVVSLVEFSMSNSYFSKECLKLTCWILAFL